RNDFLKYLCQTSEEPIGIEVDHARGCLIVDHNRKEHLDFISGIGVANIGHAHPKIVKAICDQAKRFLHVMVYGEYLQQPQVALAKRLSLVVPKPLSVTYFTNSGTEAVEGALKTAKKFTKRTRFVAFEGSFHGDTTGALSVTGREVYRKPFEPLLPNVRFLPFNATHALQTIDETTAAVIVEPIQSEAGVRVPDDDFLPALRKRCDRTGTLLIFDEVMTGLGRTGKMFASEHWNVVPDLLILAKALGGGMPLGAFIGRPEVMNVLSVDPPLSHVTTFGGHPVSCAAGLAALEVLIGESLAKQAGQKGRRLREGLKRVAEYGGIRDVRGKGMLVGLEFDHPGLTRRFVLACRKAGLLLGWTLHSDTVVRLAPPLVISQKELDRGLMIMQDALRKSVKGKA
ncbi:MAG TPA: aspartate aminotransferase family protein, partial [Nitrospiria bacterium]|nr:aspartate aminotransferase family protein [Nitrospiria bacterium]